MEYILLIISIILLIHSIGYLPYQLTYFYIGGGLSIILLFISLYRIIKRVRRV